MMMLSGVPLLLLVSLSLLVAPSTHSFSITSLSKPSILRAQPRGTAPDTRRVGTQLSVSSSPADAARKTGGRKRKPNNRNSRSSTGLSTSTSKTPQTWRVFGVMVHPDDLIKDDADGAAADHLAPAVLKAVCRRLKLSSFQQDDSSTLPTELQEVRVVRRSVDARKSKVAINGPRFAYVLDVTMKAGTALRLKPQSGRLELMSQEDKVATATNQEFKKTSGGNDGAIEDSASTKPTVLIVGAGPAGLFCALTLAQSGRVRPVLLERGQAVETRGRDIGGLMHRALLNKESNFCFGEGGAGTFSDGKLTTRIGRNSQAVRFVLETLVQYGAPAAILTEGAPHLGTDNLVRLMRNMRQSLRDYGGEVVFGAKVDQLVMNDNADGDDGVGNIKVKGVQVSYSPAVERGPGGVRQGREGQKTETLVGDAVVLATGHSARDFYETLHSAGVQLEAKGFAAGFRVEHPQRLINEIQYGSEWGPSVVTGKSMTDTANRDHFAKFATTGEDANHEGRLPVPSYRLATDKAYDGAGNRGAYSFCMCPGGQIVPASTNPGEVCVNGMSFSKRDSMWANSALVVTVAADDPVLDPYREEHGVLAGIAFQRDMEERASVMGGGNFTVPVQRLTDFVVGRASESAPPSSYRLGVKPSACHELYPAPMTKALQDAVVNHFDKQLPGFLCEEGLLHAVETRTSSPVRISRDAETLQAVGLDGLFPAGEGAGFAGGIVSAAVDGIVVAEAVLEKLIGSDTGSQSLRTSTKSIGFSY